MTEGEFWRQPTGELRIGNAERERAAAALGEHFTAGRLEADEFDERVRQAYRAHTAAELNQLFHDLPSLSPAASQPSTPRAGAGRPVRARMPMSRARAVTAALVVLAAVCWVAVVHVPPFFLFPLFWVFWHRSGGRRWGGRPWGAMSYRGVYRG